MREAPYLQSTSSPAAWAPGWLTTGADPEPWSPRELTNLEFWLPTHQLRAMWRAVTNVTQDNSATADGQLISQVDEQGPCAHLLNSPTGRQPAVGSDPGGRSYLNFSPNEYLRVKNSLGAFNWLHNGSAFSMLVWLRVAPGASTGAVFDSCRATTTGTTGISLQYNSSGTLLFMVAKQATGTAILHTTTATIDSDDGWVLVLVGYDGGSLAVLRIFSDDGQTALATELMTVSGGFDNSDASHDLHIGARASVLTNGFNGDIGDVVFLSGAISEAELDELRMWKPPQSTAPVGCRLGTYASLGPAAVSGLAEWHDFGDRTSQWQDTVGGTPVASEDDPVGVIENRLSSAATVDLKRNFAYDGTASKRPLTKDAATNGSSRAAAFFDGASGSPDDELTGPDQPTGGASTWIYVARNLDSAKGSHYSRSSGNQYLVKTGSEYLTGGGNDLRIVVHTSSSVAPNDETPSLGTEGGSGEALPGGAETWEIITVRRDGKTWTVRWNGVQSENTFLNDGVFDTSRIGPSVNSDFELDGYLGCRLRYTRALSNAEVALIEAGLAADWGITLAGS